MWNLVSLLTLPLVSPELLPSLQEGAKCFSQAPEDRRGALTAEIRGSHVWVSLSTYNMDSQLQTRFGKPLKLNHRWREASTKRMPKLDHPTIVTVGGAFAILLRHLNQ